MKIKKYLSFTLLAILSSHVSSQTTNFCEHKESKIDINGNIINVELACNQEDQSKGLMFREKLVDASGMLFVFKDSKERTFWMKNTKIPLDIIFIDSKLKIISIKTMKPYDLSTTFSDGDAMFALEVDANYAKTRNIKVGDTIRVIK